MFKQLLFAVISQAVIRRLEWEALETARSMEQPKQAYHNDPSKTLAATQEARNEFT
jgi:hypothetical protein